jgi:hypothetical protein
MLKGKTIIEGVESGQQHAIEDDQRGGRTNARENITRTFAKRMAGYFFVAHSV